MKSCSKGVNKPFIWRQASGCGCVYFRMRNFGITTIHIRGKLVVTAWPELDCRLLVTPDLWTMKSTTFGHKKNPNIYLRIFLLVEQRCTFFNSAIDVYFAIIATTHTTRLHIETQPIWLTFWRHRRRNLFYWRFSFLIQTHWSVYQTVCMTILHHRLR